MDNLTAFLSMMLDEEEEAARDALQRTTTSRRMIQGQMVTVTNRPPAWRTSLWTPERVLAEIDAKRRTLVRCREEMPSGIPRLAHFAQQTLREMALPYVDHPAFPEASRS